VGIPNFGSFQILIFDGGHNNWLLSRSRNPHFGTNRSKNKLEKLRIDKKSHFEIKIKKKQVIPKLSNHFFRLYHLKIMS
jgi:hypothetical protein